MLSRSLLPLLLILVLGDAYCHWRYLRRRSWWLRVCWWVPALILTLWALLLLREPDFIPDNPDTLFLFLFLFFLLAVPTFVFALFDAIGLTLSRWWGRAVACGQVAGIAAALLAVAALCYGSFVGFRQFRVRHVQMAFADLPPAFHGYRIVLFSDAHVGTLTGARAQLLQQAVDSINALQPDMVVFAGDLQNKRPDEIIPFMPLLGSITATDGVFSVLGNHDHPMYVEADDHERQRLLHQRMALDSLMHWHLLNNAHHIIRRGADSLVIAGMDNDGDGRRFPQLGRLQHALHGIGPHAFVVMLEHDPTAWRRKILPQSHAQLTLSGHTHGGQAALLGWTPASLVYSEASGHYAEGAQHLYVTNGLGALLPFRLFQPAEIVVVTLNLET